MGDLVPRPAGEADPRVGLQRCGDELVEVLADRFAGDPADDLTGEPAVGEGVIRVPLAGGPQWLQGCQATRDDVPVDDVLDIQEIAWRREPGPVGEKIGDRDLFFPFGGELGPVGRDGSPVVEESVLHKTRRKDGDKALGAGEDDAGGVLRPGRAVARARRRRRGVADHAAVRPGAGVARSPIATDDPAAARASANRSSRTPTTA